MKKHSFFSREDHNSLPPFLKLKADKLAAKLNTALRSKDKLGDEMFSRQYLGIIRALLFLILENPQHFSNDMVASIGEIPAIEDIGLVPEYENAVINLMHAEIAEDRHLLIEGVLDRIAEVLEK